MLPTADVLYACDGDWWHKHDGVPDFKGLKLSQDASACAKYKDVHKVELDAPKSEKIIVQKPGLIASGRNSGFQGYNIAAQFGVDRIGLIGFDMHTGNGVHWHGAHRMGLNNPSTFYMTRWRDIFDATAKTMRRLGIDVVNCSPNSALTAFPKMTVHDALARWGL